jgi:glucose/arabinose dehydrogenase
MRTAALLFSLCVCAVAAQNPPPAAPQPTPAWPTQTDAPPPPRASQFQVETIASGLWHPWAIQFLPDGRFLVTERPGHIRIVDRNGWMSSPIAGMPAIRFVAAEGLHDLVLDPDFATNRLIYFSYFAPPDGQPGGAGQGPDWNRWLLLPEPEREAKRIGFERVARARLSNDGTRLEDVTVILEGGNRRLRFLRDGTLIVTSASRAGGGDVAIDDLPQRLDLPYGKVLRINTDGSIPKDNPFVGRQGTRPEIYAIGTRDPEGAFVHPATGDLWMVEHGPMGGDELNRVRAGANLGFPVISYGRKYTGDQFTTKTAQDGMQQPIYFWVPSIGPSGLLFYTGESFPDWKGNAFVGSMPGRHLVRLVFDGERVAYEETLLADRGWRIRDVRQGPDGALYILTDEDNGRVLRLTPSIERAIP